MEENWSREIETKFTPKLDNCGEIFMFVRYAKQHADGVYKYGIPTLIESMLLEMISG